MFCEEVIEIEDIKKIYNFVYDDNTYNYYELEIIGANNSSIRIYNNNKLIKSFTIFYEKFKSEIAKINVNKKKKSVKLFYFVKKEIILSGFFLLYTISYINFIIGISILLSFIIL